MPASIDPSSPSAESTRFNRLLFVQNTDLSLTGSTIETTLKSVPVDGGFLGKGGGLWIHGLWSTSSSGAAKRMRIYGGSSLLQNISNGTVPDISYTSSRFFFNRENESTQKVNPDDEPTPFGAHSMPTINLTENTSNNFNVDFRVLLNDAADSVTLNAAFILPLIHRPLDFATPIGASIDPSSPSAASALKSWLSHASNAGSSVTGTTVETVLKTLPIKAGDMGPNDVLKILHQWSVSGTPNARTIRIYLGGTGGTLYKNIAMPNNDQSHKSFIYIWNRGALNSQVGFDATNSTGQGRSGNAVVTSAINFGADVDIVATGQLGNVADSITCEALSFEILKAPL